MKQLMTLNTDFYQVAMMAAYIFTDKANDLAGFEGFVRNIKSAVNPSQEFYIFGGEDEVNEYIKIVKEEIRTEEFREAFLELIMPKVTADKVMVEATLREKWKTLKMDFEYTVVPNGTIVFPYVPVFQFSGPRWIGQVLETFVTNIYNGRTALATLKDVNENALPSGFLNKDTMALLTGIMENDPVAMSFYSVLLENKAKEFRKSTQKVLLEAGFRRAPSFEAAKMASRIALENGWDGTSNVALLMGDYPVPASKVGGTMAHSFVMSFENEMDAYKAWNRIFPGTTMLIDTYDVVNAARMIKQMIDNGEITPPRELRIDSDPLEEYVVQVNEIFGGTIGIYVSGDMSVDRLEYFNEINLPFTKAMAGTKYCYSDKNVERLNCGFVYKVVQFTNDRGEVIRPEKKATGKMNYSGLKSCVYDEKTNVLTIDCSGTKMGFKNMELMRADAKIEFLP